MKLYFAYGSNLNKEQMSHRCPKAEALGRYTLKDARLVFRGVADVIPEEGAKCLGGLWAITSECEAALDAYEGVRGGLYRKEYFPLARPIRGESHVLIYVMNSTGIMPPSEYYLHVIREGYRDFGLKQKHLNDAVEASYDDKAPSHIERQRHARKGRPRLAERPSERVRLKAAAKALAKLPKVRVMDNGPAKNHAQATYLIRNGEIIEA